MVSARRTLAISGGSGYVGGRLAQAALAAGWDVRVLSRRPGAARPAGASLQVVDWNDPDAAAAALDGCAALLQLAAASEAEAGADPPAALRQTTVQAMAWLQAARRAAVPRVLQCSTAHVYGAADDAGAVAETVPCRPRHPYAVAHLAAEECVRMAHRRGEVRGLVVRLSNAVGAPAQPDIRRWNLLANDLCRQAAETGRMGLRSDGLAVRDFVALSDVSSAVLHLLGQPLDTAEALTVNLGGGAGCTVWELAQQLNVRAGVVLGKTLPLSRLDPPVTAAAVSDRDTAAAGASCFHLDLGRLRGLGWTPQPGALAAELDALLHFCRSHFPPAARGAA